MQKNPTSSTDPERPPKRYGLVVQGYALEFKHEIGKWPIELTQKVKGRRQKVEVVRTRRTVATLIQLSGHAEHGVEVALGEAYCSPVDTYDREMGRQLALYDLLPGLPKEAGGLRIHLGRQLLRTYLTRPGALPWAVDSHGRPQPEILRIARGGAIRWEDLG